MSKYKNFETAWCPGCGNFPILAALTEVLENSGKQPHEIMLVGGIGQAAKLNQYVNANGFSGLHGRALPAAVAAKMVNEKLTVIVNTGDGDSYGEGGNHFLHNIRRNVDIMHIVHDNQIYGLTKGQVSPTTNACDCCPEPGSFCNENMPLNPLLLAITAGATFVARSFSGDKEHMMKMMQAAIEHKGYSLLDILQPCVSFNKVNTYTYYKERVYILGEDYDPRDKMAAIEKTMQFDGRLALGIIYREERKDFQAKRKNIYDGTPIIDKKFDLAKIEQLLETMV